MPGIITSVLDVRFGPPGRAKEMRARSEVGLSRLPVTEEIAGSNPVGPAKNFSGTKCATNEVVS